MQLIEKFRNYGQTNCTTYLVLLHRSELLFREGQTPKFKTDFSCDSEKLIHLIKFSDLHEN